MFPTVVVANVAKAGTDPPNTTSLLATHAVLKGPAPVVPQLGPVQVKPVAPVVFQYNACALASLDQPANKRAVNVAIANEWFNFLLI
jgi:hypothetical protein